MVDFTEWRQNPLMLFMVFLAFAITATFISGIIFLSSCAVKPPTLVGEYKALYFLPFYSMFVKILL